MVQRTKKENDSQEASAPAAVTVYQTCIMYICNNSQLVCIDFDFHVDSVLFSFHNSNLLV